MIRRSFLSAALATFCSWIGLSPKQTHAQESAKVGIWPDEIDALLAEKKLGLIIPANFELFGPVQGGIGYQQGFGGALVGNPPKDWVAPGQALSGTDVSMYFSLGKFAPVKFARWLSVWMTDNKSVALRLVNADNGAINIVPMALIAGKGDNRPHPVEVIITDQINTLAAAGVNKNLFLQWRADAGRMILWKSVIEVYYEV